MNNRVVHFEIHASDLDMIQAFYSNVFGWEIKDMGEKFGNYRMVNTGENKPGAAWPGINGGLTPRSGEKPSDGTAVNAFVCTIDVDNLEIYMEKVKANGGTLALDKMQVPGVGWLAYMKDPEGTVFGMLQPDQK